MIRKIVSLALIAVMTVMLIPALAENSGWTMYVYTDNGKTLNVRRTPSTGNNVIGTLKFGEPVDVVTITNDGWAQILWGQSDYGEFGVAYVMSRFLVNYQPGPVPTPAPTPAPSPSADTTDYAKVFAAMNAEFKTARRITDPYIVVARPARASGWVNLRWAPSTEAERIATCRQGKELIVLAELKNWYQVQDPETAMIGFISRQYVTNR